MALLKIAKLGNPVLRNPAAPIRSQEISSEEVQRNIANMVETMRDGNGVGLAAPQVHISKRIVIVEVAPNNPRYPGQEKIPLKIIINPKLEEHSDELESDWEGCLSIPEIRGQVPRWKTVVVSGLDQSAQPIRLEARGFFARVILHEMDHLEGITFLERVTDLKTLTYISELERLGTH